MEENQEIQAMFGRIANRYFELRKAINRTSDHYELICIAARVELSIMQLQILARNPEQSQYAYNFLAVFYLLRRDYINKFNNV